MYLWNKILLGVIIVAAMGFFYMAGRAAKIHVSWLKQAEKLEKDIEQAKQEHIKLLDGEGPGGAIGLREARQELYRLTLHRPRIWANCDVQVAAQKIRVTTDKQPDPNGIAAGMLLFAFEQTPTKDQGRYLGSFIVTNVAGRQLELAPAANLFDRDLAKLGRAKKPWVLCEYLPKDNREVFATLSEAQKKAILPGETVKEYLRDGKPAEADDPPQLKDAQNNYVRALREYALLFSIYQERLNDLFDETESLKNDVKYTKTAEEQANRLNQSLQQQIAELKTRKTEAEAERDYVEQYRRRLAADIDALAGEFKKMIKENWTMGGRLAELQLEAAQRIDQRTPAVVQQSGNGLK
jgi:hypothetical protein